jgi:hypothetical protein
MQRAPALEGDRAAAIEPQLVRPPRTVGRQRIGAQEPHQLDESRVDGQSGAARTAYVRRRDVRSDDAIRRRAGLRRWCRSRPAAPSGELVTGLVFGLAPTQASGAAMSHALRDASRGSTDGRPQLGAQHAGRVRDCLRLRAAGGVGL